MTQEQVQSIGRTVLKLAGGYFIQKGFVDGSNMEVIGAGILALVGVIMSHVTHSKPPTPQPEPK